MTCEMLKEQVLSIVDTLENPPLVDYDSDGEELPDDAINCESNPSDDVWVHSYDRKVPGDHVAVDRLTADQYRYDEDDDAWVCLVTGQRWEGFGTGYFWGIEEGDLILGGEEVTCVGPMSGFDYLSDVLDIEYRVGSDREYRSAELLVTFGGPNIWIDTKRNMVVGAWWGDHYEAPYRDEMGLDDACEELFNC